MLTLSHPLAPTLQETISAQEVAKKLQPFTLDKTDLTLQILSKDGSKGEVFHLSASTLKLISELLNEVAGGRNLAVASIDEELTTQEAADLMKVSRTYLVKLLNGGEIPCRKVGNQRRLKFADVVNYQKRIETERHKVLDELVKQAQELNMGYK